MKDVIFGCGTVLGIALAMGWTGYCLTDCHFAEPVMGSYTILETTFMNDSDGGVVFYDGLKFESGHRCEKYTFLHDEPTACIAPDGVTSVMLTENARRSEAFNVGKDTYTSKCCVAVVPRSDTELLAGVRSNLTFLYKMDCLKRGAILIGTFAMLGLALMVAAGLILGFMAGKSSTESALPPEGLPEVP